MTSGGYHVWSSDDCNASEKAKVTTLNAGQSAVTSITWEGGVAASCTVRPGDPGALTATPCTFRTRAGRAFLGRCGVVEG